MITPSQVASYYDVELDDFREDILSALIQSKENAGKHGKSRRQYFDGYMSDTIAERRADDRAAQEFERNAY